MDITSFLILALATWRLSSLINREDGPYDILAKFRHFAGVRYDDYSIPYGTTVISKGLLCMWCLSVWIGGLIGLSYLIFGNIIFWVCLPMALSGFAVMTEIYREAKHG